MNKPLVSFEPGDNIFLLIGRMKKALDEETFNKFHKEMENLNYKDIIILAEKYVIFI